MRKDKLTELIFAQQLVSVMNQTKWWELAEVITSHRDFTPTVRLGYVDGYAPTGFSRLDWEWVKLGDTRIIKWVEIDPVRYDWVGRLVTEQQTDFSDWVRESLLKHSIPFVQADGLFRIDAYLQPSEA